MRAFLPSLTLVVVATPLLASGHAVAESVAVVASAQRPFQEAARAALGELDGNGTLYDATAVRQDSSAVRDSEVIISIGPLAGGGVAHGLSPDAFVIAILTPRLMGLPEERTVIVPLDPSPDDVLDVTRRLLPGKTRVGVLLGKSGPPASELAATGRRFGLEIVASDRKERLTSALDRLLPVVDVLWVDRSHAAVRDAEAMKLVLARSADAGRPVIGSSKNHVLAGALFAVVPDPASHGKVAGELARRMGAGERVRVVPVPPGTVVWSSRAASAYGARVPRELTGRVEHVR